METQLLFLLDFDLHFDEQEACVHFSPFMAVRIHCVPTPATPEQQETRAAAVDRVTKAGKARAQAQLPPTPPHEAVPAPLASSTSSLASTVRSIARRLSSNALSVPLSLDVPASSPRCSTLSNTSRSSSHLSAGSSEMGSLVSDSGSSSSPDSLSDCENDPGSQERPFKRFSLRPVPPHACRQGRKTSDTASINTVKGNTCTLDSSPFISSRRVAFELSPSKRSGQRANSYLGVTSVSFSDISPNIPKVKESVSMSGHGSGNFLSRIWGAATKTQEKVDLNLGISGKTTLCPPAISIVEPKESYPQLHGASAFRRLVHSRSAVFRNGDI
jgi:PHO85 cyclin-1